MVSPDFSEMDATALAAALASGDVSPVAITHHYLERIAERDSAVHAFTIITAEAALERAAALESAGFDGSTLWGLPLADKDLQHRRGTPIAAGGPHRFSVISDVDDPLVQALDRSGAISVGKTRTPEFGLAGHGPRSDSPPTVHPFVTGGDPGGSSSGAAVAVAAGMLPFAPGSDGGGSVRIPAATNGLVGLKPSRGRVPGGSGLASLGGLAVAGTLTRTVRDAALLLDGMLDRSDPAQHLHRPVVAPGGNSRFLSDRLRNAEPPSGSGRRIAVVTTSPWHTSQDLTVHNESIVAVSHAAETLAGHGFAVEYFNTDYGRQYPEAFTTVWQVGAASLRLEAARLASATPLTRWLATQGSKRSAVELADALRHLAAFEESVITQWAPFDAVLTPALGLPPQQLSWYPEDDPEENFRRQVRYSPFTSMVNVAGLPAVTVPVLDDPERWAARTPVSVQLIGRPGDEHTILLLASALEAARTLRAE